MSNQNYTLKNPKKNYIWLVRARGQKPTVYLTYSLNPKDFYFQVGQYVDAYISSMELIGYKIVKDHYGHDVEDIYQTTGKFMKKEILDNYNEEYKDIY